MSINWIKEFPNTFLFETQIPQESVNNTFFPNISETWFVDPPPGTYDPGSNVYDNQCVDLMGTNFCGGWEMPRRSENK